MGYTKEDAKSPTVHTESLFIMAAISTSKGRNVIILDIAETFLCTLVKDEVTAFLKESLAETIVLVDSG